MIGHATIAIMKVSALPTTPVGPILATLEAAFGRPDWRPTGRPLEELVRTILSQHTSDINSARAYQTLVERFPTFATVRDAPTPLVAEAIRSGGLAEVKAQRIQAVLRALSPNGGPPALPDLAALPLDEARRFLTDLPGVGPKTAACVLLFAVGRPALPVDTHVHRVGQRLGLIPARLSATAAHAVLEAMTPPDDVYSLHVNLIRLGRRVCRAPVPRCGACCLRARCPYPAKTGLVGNGREEPSP
jgi:endonuclease-3